MAQAVAPGWQIVGIVPVDGRTAGNTLGDSDSVRRAHGAALHPGYRATEAALNAVTALLGAERLTLAVALAAFLTVGRAPLARMLVRCPLAAFLAAA